MGWIRLISSALLFGKQEMPFTNFRSIGDFCNGLVFSMNLD